MYVLLVIFCRLRFVGNGELLLLLWWCLTARGHGRLIECISDPKSWHLSPILGTASKVEFLNQSESICHSLVLRFRCCGKDFKGLFVGS